MTLRREEAGDADAIRAVNKEAFAGSAEADLIDALRTQGGITLSCVAVESGRVVGHILFTPVTIASEKSSTDAIALGPMAVLPGRQRTGVGTRLVNYALDALRAAGHSLVVVLGHPAYYPRFGFAPASRLGITCAYDAPDDAFMALELRAGAWRGKRGEVQYRPEFDACT